MEQRTIHVEQHADGPGVEAAIAAVATERDPSVLDSADAAPGRGRFLILACNPITVLATQPGEPDPFESLRDRLRQLPREGAPEPLPFVGGWIGYFAYEAGHYIEQIGHRARRDILLPVARWALYDSAALYDTLDGTWRITAADLRGVYEGAPDPLSRLAEWKQRLHLAARKKTSIGDTRSGATSENMSLTEYLDRVRRAKEFIAAGDIFQVNLARRFTLPQVEPPIATYLRLRRRNPAAYAAFLSWADGQTAILSASPELFLEVNGRDVVTRPIKGTRPRSPDPVVDESLRQELLASQKDRAELAMIVDLERNDLGRVCEYGSVRVEYEGDADSESETGEPAASAPAVGDSPALLPSGPDLTDRHFATLEPHPTVHHLVATVRGRLREECDLIDLLRATFPGGSITGAPKVRAMQIIDELEPTQRSVYTGAIGFISLNGRMTLNIAIRTLIITDGSVHTYVGSGIVADSDPHEEYAETTAKAAGLCRALGLAEGRPAVDEHR